MHLNILIADDDAADRKIVKRALDRSSITADITEVDNVLDAQKTIKDKTFDCIIFDYHMPGGNVLDTIKTLHHTTPYTTIIMATGQGDEMLACAAFKAGALDYIPKSMINTENLERSISNACEKTKLKKQINEQKQSLHNYAHVLAHDLRSPAAQIISFLEMVELSFNRGDLENITTYIDFSKTASTHIIELIDALDQYNKAESAEMAVTQESMSDIIKDALSFSDLYIQNRNAKVKIMTKLPQISCNKPQMIQLIQNLINNGIKYNRNARPQIIISSNRTANGWEFSVKDNGIGIPKKQQSTIFKMFSRLHMGCSQFDGSGVGLATCKKIIERHGGKIWVESREGFGTTFHFTVPGQWAQKNPANHNDTSIDFKAEAL